MHLLIPFAFCSSEGCASVLPTLPLPHLQKLLSRLTPEPMDTGDEFSLSAPHERALARAITLVESHRPDHRARASALLDVLLERILTRTR